MVKTWLITGGNGFVGTNLRIGIMERFPKHRVLVVDTKDHNSQFTDGSKAFKISACNSRSMGKIFDKYQPNYVVHLAAETNVRDSLENPKKCIERNLSGTLNCLESAAKYDCESIVIASSCGVSGEQFVAVDENTKYNPISPYATSKVCSEEAGNCYAKFGLNVCNLRFSNIYGPWSDHKSSVVSEFIKAFLSGKPLEINGTGRQTRNFIHVNDAINAILICVKKMAVGTYCIAGDKSISINDLASIICDIGGEDVELIYNDSIDGEIIDVNVDNLKARRELMFQCEYSIVDGIAETIKWFRRLRSGTL
jgi:UDP-glucose 4-epimerase